MSFGVRFMLYRIAITKAKQGKVLVDRTFVRFRHYIFQLKTFLIFFM